MASNIKIAQEDLGIPDLNELLSAHIASLQAINQENNQMGHLLDLSGLQKPNISIFSARDVRTNEIMGCAAIKEISRTHAELKSMRTALEHVRRGVAAALVKHLLEVSKARGYKRLSLETGEQEQFAPATALYRRCGFVDCEPYEGYEDAPPVGGSIFMTYHLDK